MYPRQTVIVSRDVLTRNPASHQLQHPSQLQVTENINDSLDLFEYSYNDENEVISDCSVPVVLETGVYEEFNEYAGLSLPFLGDLLSPKASLCHKHFQIGFNNLIFLGHPVILPGRVKANSDLSSVNSSSTEKSDESQTFEISMFHVVFVLAKNSNVSLDNFYDKVVKRLSLSLKTQQEQCQYVKREVEIILAETKNFIPGPNSLNQTLEKKSSLASLLVHIFEKLNTKRPFQVSVNNRVTLSFSSNWGAIALANFEPYNSLLLLEDKIVLLESLTKISSSFSEFFDNLSPRRSLDEVRKKLLWPWDKVKNHASHLLKWDKAKVILPFTLDSLVCRVNPDMDYLHDYSFLAEWKKRFYRIDLFALLSKISSRIEPISYFVPGKDSQNVLLQMSTTYFLNYVDDETGEEGFVDPSDPYFEPTVDKILLKVKEKQQTFSRSVYYFDGEHNIEEILFFEPKVSRKDFNLMLEEYKDYIVPFFTTYNN